MKKFVCTFLFLNLFLLFAEAQVTSVLWGVDGNAWNPTNSILRDFTDVGYKGGAEPIPGTNDWPNAVSILDYGAIANDGIDDTAAFNAAISNCPDYSAVFVPRGRYLITDTIVFSRERFVLRGEDMYESIIFFPKNTSEVWIKEVGWQPDDTRSMAGGSFFSMGDGQEKGVENLTIEFREQRKISPWEYIGARFGGFSSASSNCWMRNLYIKNCDSGIGVFGQYHSLINIIFDQFNGRQAVDNDQSGKLDGYSAIMPRNMSHCLFHNIKITGNLLQPIDNNESSSHSVYSRISTGEGNNRVVGLHGGSTRYHLYTELNRAVTRHYDTGDPLYGQFFDCTYWNIDDSMTSNAYTAADNESIYVGYGDDFSFKSNATYYYEPADFEQLTPGNLYLAQLDYYGRPHPEGFATLPLEPYEREGDVFRVVPDDDATPNQGYASELTLKNGVYFKFDLSQATETNVAAARLRFTLKRINNAPFRVAAYSVSDDNWVETDLTTSNKPAVGTTVLDSELIQDGRSNLVVELDVTSFVRDELVGGDGVISLYADYPEGNGFLSTAWPAEQGQKPELIVERVADSVPGPPSAPKGISSTALVGNIMFDWDDNPESDVATYNVYRSPSADGWLPQSGGLVTSDHVDVSSVDDWHVGMMDYNKVYHYWITAVDEHGYESEKSKEFVAAVVHPDNDPPAFAAGPLTLANAWTGDAYSENIAMDASDNESDQMYFMKVSGPDWLDVALDGTLSGTPAISDAANEQVVVQVTALGGSDQAVFNLSVKTESDVPAGAPAAPTHVVAVAGGSQVSLSWASNDEPDFASYTVYRATTSGDYGSALAVGLSSSTYVDDTAENDTTYYYVVRANDYTGNESTSSIEVSATPELDFVPPAAPTGLVATAGDQVVTLNWNENSEIDLDSYKVYRSTTSSNDASTALATVSTNTYVDATVENGETYYYAIAAVDTSDNESIKSVEDSATPADMTPAAPIGLSAMPGDGSVALSWEENAGDNLVTYSIYRSTNSGSYSSVLTNGLTSTNYLDNTAVNGTTYYYVIRAVTAGIYESLLSQEVSATPVEPNIKVVGYYPFSGSSKASSDSDTNSVAGDMVVGAGITTFKWETRGFWTPTAPSAYFEAGTDCSDGTVLDDDYFSFTITPETGLTLDFDSISFTDRSGGFSVSVASDQNSFATVIASTNAAGSWAENTLDLSSLSSTTNATEIRLYFHNGSGAQVIDNITILAAPVSDEPPAEDTTPPASPTGLDATAGNGSVSLDWNDNEEGDMGTYSIYRSTISGHYGPALLTGQESSDYVDNTAVNGTTYYYVVSAIDTNSNESTRSAEVSATPAEPNYSPVFISDPIEMGNATEEVIYTSSIAGSATDGNDGDSLSYSKTSGPAWLHISANGVLSGMPTNGDVGLNSWTLQVDDGNGGVAQATLKIMVHAAADATPPVAPVNLVAEAGNGQISLTWNANSEDDLGGYSVYRSTTSGNYTAALTNGLSSTNFVDETVMNGETYYYVASATDTNGNESTVSSEVSATPNAPASGGYDQWASDHGVGASSADDDADGMNNFYEYAMGGNPTNPAMHGTLPVFSKSAKGFVYVYPQRSDDTGLTYSVETRTSLISGSWSNTGYTVAGTNVTGGTIDFVTNDVGTVENETFIRLKIEQ